MDCTSPCGCWELLSCSIAVGEGKRERNQEDALPKHFWKLDYIGIRRKWLEFARLQ